MGTYMYLRGVSVTMSSNVPSVGMNHLTVVPENFERCEERCPNCRAPLDEAHDADECQSDDYF